MSLFDRYVVQKMKTILIIAIGLFVVGCASTPKISKLAGEYEIHGTGSNTGKYI